jgi:uncharacterized membrane protein
MFTWRLFVLFLHVTAVIIALGGSIFSTFALTPILADDLAPAARLEVVRRVVRRQGAIVLSALTVLVLTGILNLLFLGAFSLVLVLKLIIVAVVVVLALHQYANLGAHIWKLSAGGPSAEIAVLQARFRRVGLIVGVLVLIIVYLSLGLTRVGAGVISAAS